MASSLAITDWRKRGMEGRREGEREKGREGKEGIEGQRE